MFDSEGLKAELSNHFPYVSVRVYHAAIDTVFIRLALHPKDQWPNGYFENSKCGIFVAADGKIELISEGLNAPQFRKTSIKDLVNKLIKWKEAYT
jgi:hypothetical protein